METLRLKHHPGLWQIAREVARKHEITVSLMRSRRRVGPIVAARFEFCYRALCETHRTFGEIARVLLLNHTSVAYGATRHAMKHQLPAPRGFVWSSINTKLHQRRRYPQKLNDCGPYALRVVDRELDANAEAARV